MKSNQPSNPNKKLILHFDIDNVIRLPVRKNKDLYVTNILFRFMIFVQIGYGENFKKIINKTLI